MHVVYKYLQSPQLSFSFGVGGGGVGITGVRRGYYSQESSSATTCVGDLTRSFPPPPPPYNSALTYSFTVIPLDVIAPGNACLYNFESADNYNCSICPTAQPVVGDSVWHVK